MISARVTKVFRTLVDFCRIARLVHYETTALPHRRTLGLSGAMVVSSGPGGESKKGGPDGSRERFQ